MVLENATGWNEMFAGNLPKAVYVMYDGAMAHWTLVILFFTFQVLAIMKTHNPILAWIIGVFFASLYFAGGSVLGADMVFNNLAMQVMFVVLVVELAAIIFGWFLNR